MIEIKEVVTKKDKKLFASYPVKLYKGCPYYVPSLRSDEMATFDKKKNFSLEYTDAKGFLCYKDGKLVGRIAGFINKKHNALTGGKYIRFSRLECIDDLDVFKALLKAVAKYGKENGMEIMHGPWGFNDTDREGLLNYGFDKRSTYATNYYYPYFSENLKKLGFQDESKWCEYKFVIPSEAPERIIAIAEKLKKRYSVVDVADTLSVKKILSKYGEEFFETMTLAYQHLDGYVPIVGKERENMLSQFATIVNRRYISILVDNDGKVAGLAIVLPSICDALIKSRGKLFPFGFIGVLKSIMKPKELEMALIAIHPKYKNSGINAIMIARIIKNLIDDKVQAIESNPMLEHNHDILQQWKFAESEIAKKRQTYVKNVDDVLSL